ncbi:10028_t:CDS:2, partial [Scutellospora calospora]
MPSITDSCKKILKVKSSLEDLETKIEYLKEAQESAKHDEWTERIARVENAKVVLMSSVFIIQYKYIIPLFEPLKKILDTNMQVLLEQKFVDNLKLRLSKINRHKKLQMVRDERQRRRETLHKTIDEWRTEWIAKELALKREQARRREAEKRVQEAEANRNKHRELSKLLEKVKKLRDLRRERLKREGHFFPEEDDEFFNKVASLNDVMKIEEARLDEERNAAAEHKRNEAMDVGMKEREKERDPVYEYWHQAEFDIDDLISIRCQWDAFLVAPSTTGASCIPPYFIDPSPPANYVWATCLTH